LLGRRGRLRRRGDVMRNRGIRLTGRATRFLGLLVDFGHMDESRIDDVLIALAEEYGVESGGRLLDLADVRPLVATLLVAMEPGGAASGNLAEDWAPLFF